MTTYFGTANYPNGNYRLDIQARTSEVAGGTLVEPYAVVTMVTNPGIPAFGPAGQRSWSLPGARRDSTAGTPDQSGSSTISYNFSNENPKIFYNYFNRFIPYSYGSSTTLTITVASGTSSTFFTSRTITIDVPLFQPAGAKYALTYNANGGSPTPASQSLDAGASFTVGAAPTRSGFVFSGWSGSDGNTYTPGTSATMPAGALTLTAVWSGGTVSGVTVGTITQNSISITWNRTSGVSYNVYLNQTLDATTTAGSHTFRNLTPGTLYSLGVAAVTDAGEGAIARVSATTIVPDPAYAENANYATAKIGLFYSSSVTATNGQSYSLAYGSLPPGLTLSANGTISGTPEQRAEDRLYFNEAGGYLDIFTFGVRVTGPQGTSAVTKQFSIKTVFPAVRFATETSPRSMIIARRWNGTSWLPIQQSGRFDGNSWIDLSTG